MSLTLSAPAAGRVLYVSRSAPPGGSGSAHVLRGLLSADRDGAIVAAGACSFWGKPVRSGDGVHLFPTELSLFGRGARFFAPLRQCLRRLLARRLAILASDARIVRIVCVFPDALYCQAALDAARTAGKPVDIYFHNTYADNRGGIAGAFARRLEQRMLEQSQRLLFISEALMLHFQEKYPRYAGKCRVAPHPVAGPPEDRVEARGFRGEVVNATLIGNLNPSNFDAAARLLRALSGHPSLRIRLCTPVPRMLLKARGMDLEGVDYLGYLADSEMPALMEDTDLFLLPHGLAGGYSAHEYKTIFPTRAAHYLAHGRPVLAHSPEDSGLSRFLRRHDCAELVTLADEPAIRQAFERLRSDPARQQQLAGNALAVAGRFRPESVLGIVLATEPRP